MLDFKAVRAGELSYDDLVSGLTKADLGALTHEMIDLVLSFIVDCEDEDVVFVPDDPAANDTFATEDGVQDLAWTLGHVIVHMTASAEESAALAAELARGAANTGRSRSEVAWTEVTTVAQCRARLAESRRMRLASLEMWPDVPYWDNRAELRKGKSVNAVGRFVQGLSHSDAHLEQVQKIVAQAKGARGV